MGYADATSTEPGDARSLLLKCSKPLALNASRAVAIGGEVDAERFRAGGESNLTVSKFELQSVAKAPSRGQTDGLTARDFQVERFEAFSEEAEGGRKVADDQLQRPSEVLEHVVDVDLKGDKREGKGNGIEGSQEQQAELCGSEH